jgi:protein involved in polysaccharide export with SLBB domain
MMQRVTYLCSVVVVVAATLFIILPEHASAQSRGAQQAARAEVTTDGPSYVLGPSDRVRLRVYGEGDITGDYEVDTNGYISVPLAGRVKAAGLTTRQLERSVADALSRGVLKDPRVNIEIATYRPFFILGEVKKAGEYPYKSGLTVLDAVASAGGYTYRANEGKVVIRRAGSTIEETHSLNAPVPVFPGDNIRIPERYF